VQSNGLEARLGSHVNRLATEIGPRNIYYYEALQRAAAYIESTFREAGYSPLLHTYRAHEKPFVNIAAELRGKARAGEIVIVGAHYDTHQDSPGANDNGSAMAALLELACLFARAEAARTLRFVAFTNEETPFTLPSTWAAAFMQESAGSSMRTSIGCYSEEIGSQRLSFGGLLLPRRGDFVALVGNRSSKGLHGSTIDPLAAVNRVPGSPTDLLR
jgi:hypothetical protein